MEHMSMLSSIEDSKERDFFLSQKKIIAKWSFGAKQDSALRTYTVWVVSGYKQCSLMVSSLISQKRFFSMSLSLLSSMELNNIKCSMTVTQPRYLYPP